MTTTQDLLVEIGTEELPASHQLSLANALGANINQALLDAKLTTQTAKVFATPRRIGVVIEDVSSMQGSQKKQKLGPNVSSAYDSQGMPSIACIGFAKSAGVSVDQLEKIDTPKGIRVGVTIDVQGQATKDLLPEIIASQIKKLPINKPMRWGDHPYEFIRPVKWMVVLFGQQVIPHKGFNLQAGRETIGHRFHHPEPLSIREPREYESRLYSLGYVMADFAKRKAYIEKKLNAAVPSTHRVIVPQNLLHEVTSLVEWPVILKGKFDAQFLSVPREALITSMQSHQKVFPIENQHGQLQPEFLIVSNIDSKDPSKVIHGNERVIRARLSDAEFFYKKDSSQDLASHSKALKSVIFQEKLGSIDDKSRRIAKLSVYIAKQLNENEEQAKRAALLCKCDLLSEMVGEFPSLQGTMGGYYATASKENPAVAQAISEHYQPRFAQDSLPESMLGSIVSIADKIDTVVGVLGIKLRPTGEKDPYGLRRAGLSILKIMIEKSLPLDLLEIIKRSAKAYAGTLTNDDVVNESFEFICQRLKAYYTDRGIDSTVFIAVNALTVTCPADFHKRIIAVEHFQTLPEAAALAQANKRVANILKKQKIKTTNAKITINSNLACEEAEVQLIQALAAKMTINQELNAKSNYSSSLTELANLKQPIDNFFENVMIMADDAKLRKNRLAIVQQIHQLFSQVADISQLS
jgi:glycyl-tRNA synthetase beta chain